MKRLLLAVALLSLATPAFAEEPNAVATVARCASVTRRIRPSASSRSTMHVVAKQALNVSVQGNGGTHVSIMMLHIFAVKMLALVFNRKC